MFFKRLEMTGFKSFATKTVLDFLPGITVIVGPNGCGKSNIFDAVRWALGEQRPRVLRGQRMGDVIFSGSASYKAQSMASVSLIVNNEDRRLPLDFSEIQIARRLFRVGDGEFDSEYLVNRASCRLREITDLFLDTGIGTNSYSIMEQGHVDFIINARPGERRYLFDEAVGISKYRQRREEALRKLERTEADLLRLADILSEIKSRLRSLKIQANRAERYKQLVAELRRLERDLLLIGYRGLLAEKHEVDNQFDTLNAALQAVVANMAQLDQALVDRQVEMDRLARESESQRTRRLECATELERVQGQRAVLRERIETTEAQMRRDEFQIASLRERRGQLVERHDQLASQIAALGEELSRLETDSNAHRRRFEELVQSQSDARQRLAQLRDQTRRAIEEKTHHENERRIASLMKQQAEENLAETQSQLDAATAREAALAAQLDQLQTERTNQAEALARLQAQADRLETVQREQTERLRAMEEERAAASRAHQAAESRRQALRVLQENYEGFVRGVRELMGAAGRDELHGVLGTVATLFESRPEDELAVETALAGHVQDIVVTNEQAALEGIAFLRRGQLGRATFLPVEGMRPDPRDPRLSALCQQPGVAGVVADLVTTDARLRPIAEALLGGTVLVEDLATAQTLRNHGHRACFVTRDGTILAPDGALTGGHVRPSGLLGRERELRELGKEIERLAQTMAALESRIAELTATIEATSAQRAELGDGINAARNGLAQTEREIERVAEDRAEAHQAVEQIQRERERLNEKIAGYEASLDEHGRALEQSDARTAALQAQLEEVEVTHDNQDQQLAILQEALAQMMAQVSASRERLEAAQGRLAEIDEEISRCDEQIQQHTQQLDALSQSLDQACAEIERAGQRHAELTAALEALDRDLAERSQQREAVSAEVQRLQHELHARQRERNEQQNALHEVDRRRAQCEVQLQNLDEQAREKFRASADELAREAGEIAASREQLVSDIAALRGRIESMGEVNVIAIEEHRQLSERYEFLLRQQHDLEEAKTSLRKTIRTIDATSTEMFTQGMVAIREHFRETFRRLFGGGRADLILTDPEDVLNSGVEILAQPPGKQLQGITLLSGGEKALTAIALLFGIFLFRPSPFCVLDEIDAPLDDANIERFKNMVLEFSKNIQFIIITHNKQTMALADTLYGVTMEEPGVSRIVSVRFDQVEEAALVG